MKNEILKSTDKVIRDMHERQGGNLFFYHDQFISDFDKWITAVKIPKDYIPLKIYIRGATEVNRYKSMLILMVNPSELNRAHTHEFDGAFVRKGWVITPWGSQVPTLSVSGTTAGFYWQYGSNRGGLTNFNRKKTPAFINLMSLIAMYRNNGCHYMDSDQNPNMLPNSGGVSPNINVIDTVGIEYDGVEYEGSFDSLNIKDSNERPYLMEYGFEFSVLRKTGEPINIDGHICRDGNERSKEISISLQGHKLDLEERVGMDVDKYDLYGKISNDADRAAEAREKRKSKEDEEEKDWTREKRIEGVVTVPDRTIRVSRGWLDRQQHPTEPFACDYRPARSRYHANLGGGDGRLGPVLSLTEGRIFGVSYSSEKGGRNWVKIVSTKQELINSVGRDLEGAVNDFLGSSYGVMIWYNHIDNNPNGRNVIEPFEVRQDLLNRGTPHRSVSQGQLLGFEGTDGGAFYPHIHLEWRIINNGNDIVRSFWDLPRRGNIDLLLRYCLRMAYSGWSLNFKETDDYGLSGLRGGQSTKNNLERLGYKLVRRSGAEIA